MKKTGYKMINARAESITEKPVFRASFQRKRCLIPADSFYEWKKIGTDKQPMRILRKDEGIFSMAGLYDTWTAPDGQKVSTCTIITTTPNELMADIHDRMPVILKLEDEKIWLDRTQKVENLQALLRPFPAEDMFAYPVSKIVGNVKNDSPECTEALNV
jgi:putative SOS response-associated peptidase YedK